MNENILKIISLCSLWFNPPLLAADPRPLPRFDRVVIDANFPGGYQVEVADVNGDGKPDVVGVGGGTCAWYENPGWTKRIISDDARTPRIISNATADLDGDGKAEVAIAYEFEMNTPATGKLALAIQGSGADDPWTIRPIADVPSIHRLRWGDVDGDKQLDLVVSPIFGPKAKPPTYDQDPASVLVFRPRKDPRGVPWPKPEPVTSRPVLHAIRVVDFDGDGAADVLTADNLGVQLCRRQQESSWEGRSLAPGAPGGPPKRGASEIHVGRLGDGTRFLATVEPWHGNEVAIYRANGPTTFGPRTVIDDTLADGHALWVSDVDGDGDDEVFAGHRGKDARVSAYDFDGKTWVRTVLDRAITAQDLRGGDLDGDGTPDVVGIGGASHNVVWYRPIKDKP